MMVRDVVQLVSHFTADLFLQVAVRRLMVQRRQVAGSIAGAIFM